jgi:hypothetical protein
MGEKENTLSRNPNICASCSSLTDGMNETGVAELADSSEPGPSPKSSSAKSETVPSQPDGQPSRTNPHV